MQSRAFDLTYYPALDAGRAGVPGVRALPQALSWHAISGALNAVAGIE